MKFRINTDPEAAQLETALRNRDFPAPKYIINPSATKMVGSFGENFVLDSSCSNDLFSSRKSIETFSRWRYTGEV